MSLISIRTGLILRIQAVTRSCGRLYGPVALFPAGLRSNRPPSERSKAKTDHLIESRFWLLLIFHDQTRMTEPDARGVDEARRKRGISRRKLVRGHAIRDDLFQNPRHAFRMPAHDSPIFGDRRFDQIVQLAVEHKQFMVCFFHGTEQVAYFLSGSAA